MRARLPADDLWAMVLAAGGSRRLAYPKQLIEVEGQSLIRRCVDMANVPCGKQVIVVLGAAQQAIEPMLTGADAKTVFNPDWRTGLSTSLRAGVRALPTAASGVLLVLVDQALLQSDSLTRLATAWRQQPGRIVTARYGGSLGPPAIFPKRFFPDLLKLRGDRGAKQFLRVHAKALIDVAMPEAEFDLDTEADLDQLRQIEAHSCANPKVHSACGLQALDKRPVRDAHPALTLETRCT
jgi:CTP:molybdopterin cytidylyltransferase MocA